MIACFFRFTDLSIYLAYPIWNGTCFMLSVLVDRTYWTTFLFVLTQLNNGHQQEDVYAGESRIKTVRWTSGSFSIPRHWRENVHWIRSKCNIEKRHLVLVLLPYVKSSVTEMRREREKRIQESLPTRSSIVCVCMFAHGFVSVLFVFLLRWATIYVCFAEHFTKNIHRCGVAWFHPKNANG